MNHERRCTYPGGCQVKGFHHTVVNNGSKIDLMLKQIFDLDDGDVEEINRGAIDTLIRENESLVMQIRANACNHCPYQR